MMNKTKTVFLGGTTNDSQWRFDLQAHLHPNILTFNPAVSVWNEVAAQNELNARKRSDFMLYVITPKMIGYSAIADVIDESNKRPKKTLMCILREDGDYEFTYQQLLSLDYISKLVVHNGGIVFTTLEEVASYLNGKVS
jgi:hypothetical protein